jgi:hypothetical protein
MKRNTHPDDIYEILRRMLNCNWKELAEQLEVSPLTLRKWRKEGAGANGTERLHNLFHQIICRAECEWITISYLNFQHIRTINGKR